MSRRNTKRHRREPVRHPIPQARLTASPARPRFDPDHPRLPLFETSGMAGALEKGPVEVLPLYAALAVVHQSMSGAPINVCVPVCHQIATALGHLGFDLELMAAYAEVRKGDTVQGSLGVRGPAVIRPDLSTDGHAVLWAASFGRLVDPTVAQHPLLLAAAHRGQHNQTAPLAVEVPGGRDTLLRGGIGAIRHPFQVVYLVQPQYTSAFDPWFAEFRNALEYGGLNLAHTTLEAIAQAGTLRNLRELPRRYPRLGALLAGREHLPALPEQPPASWTRLTDAAAREPNEQARSPRPAANHRRHGGISTDKATARRR